jgi:hypothetical protein
MANSSDTQPVEALAPPTDLKALGDRLVGAWKISGESEGETTWEWRTGLKPTCKWDLSLVSKTAALSAKLGTGIGTGLSGSNRTSKDGSGAETPLPSSNGPCVTDLQNR